MTDTAILSTILTSPEATFLGIGGLIGFAVGKALKFVSKIVIVIAGLFMFGLGGLAYYGIISINYNKLENTAQAVVTQAYNHTAAIVESMAKQFNQHQTGGSFISGGIGFMGGFALASKIG